MSHVYTPALADFLTQKLAGGADIRVLLVMTGSTAPTEEDAQFVADITTLTEYDGANYVRKALTSEAVAQDDPNDRGEFTSDDVVWSALGNGSGSMIGAVFYKHVTNDADSPLLWYYTFASPPTPGGLDFRFSPNAEGWLQAKNP